MINVVDDKRINHKTRSGPMEGNVRAACHILASVNLLLLMLSWKEQMADTKPEVKLTIDGEVRQPACQPDADSRFKLPKLLSAFQLGAVIIPKATHVGLNNCRLGSRVVVCVGRSDL